MGSESRKSLAYSAQETRVSFLEEVAQDSGIGEGGFKQREDLRGHKNRTHEDLRSWVRLEGHVGRKTEPRRTENKAMIRSDLHLMKVSQGLMETSRGKAGRKEAAGGWLL